MSFDFRILKERVSIDQVLRAYNLIDSLKRRGDQLRGHCPLHAGNNPSAFSVHLKRGAWHCFTHCGGGDIVELVRRIHRCDYATAARHLNQLAQGERIHLKTDSGHPNAKEFRPFRYQIPLQHHPFLQRKGIRSPTARLFDAGCTDQSAFLKDTVAVRLFDLQGNPLGYCGRRLLEREITRWGKWRFPRGFPKARTLFNAHRVEPSRGLIIVECPWAVMRLHQLGLQAVALLGTALSKHQEAWLADAPSILLLMDGDEAGRKAALGLSRRLQVPTFVGNLPDGLEPEDLSDEQLSSLVKATVPFSLNQYPSSYFLLVH